MSSINELVEQTREKFANIAKWVYNMHMLYTVNTEKCFGIGDE